MTDSWTPLVGFERRVETDCGMLKQESTEPTGTYRKIGYPEEYHN
jgi:hypothetical protein